MKKRIPPTIPSFRRRTGVLAAAALASILASASVFAGGDEVAPVKAAKDVARLSSGARIEWTAPDTQTARDSVSNQTANNDALIIDEKNVSCPLPEGETTFVIKMSSPSFLDRFTFVNEDVTTATQLKISVSDKALPAASPEWMEVEGNVAFQQKRKFNLSMVGVSARYVKLCFRVEKAERVAALGL